MADLLNGSIEWDFVAKQLHTSDLKAATSGLITATKPAPVPPAADALSRAAASLRVANEAVVLEQTRRLARLGLAARDLGHYIADNLRRLNTQEEPHP